MKQPLRRAHSNSATLRLAVAALAVAAILGGCTAANSSPTPASSSGQATPSSQPSPSWSATALPSVGVAPSGRWTGIKWINAGFIFPFLPTNGADVVPYPTVFGWSKGFVGFTATAVATTSGSPKATMAAVESPDGLHWTVGRALDVSGLDTVEPPTSVVESPAGLLAVGRGFAGVCGGPPSVGALWTSTDGLSWSRVTLPTDFADATIATVDGGSTGFVAAGVLKDGTTQAIWTSKDGRSWRQVRLASSVFGDFDVAGAAVFGGGYVVSGAVHMVDGCGANMVTPSLWWSIDGDSWTRDALPGAVPTSSAWLTVTKINDYSLMALSSEWNDTTQLSSQRIWVSADGKAWKPVDSASKLLTPSIFTDGKRAISLVSPGAADPTVGDGPLVAATVADDLSVATLGQTGDGPAISPTLSSWSAAFGPTGIVVLSLDGTNLWLGVPTTA
ncbi:MAG TPA: hypothetical protein VF375_06250 [Candidatus Limnocylindrales bacterium]